MIKRFVFAGIVACGLVSLVWFHAAVAQVQPGGSVTLKAGTAIIGKVGIDQTTPGITNNVTTSGKGVVLTDRSGTITSGGAAQVLAAANAARTGFLIQNVSVGDLWINSLTTAVAAQPSIWLPAGSYYEYPSTGVPLTAISIFGATTGQAFAAREW